VIESLSRRLADVTIHLSFAQRTRAEWALLTSAERRRWGSAYDEGADPALVIKEVIVWVCPERGREFDVGRAS
jgi:hypothetical protein